jgi:hypothetical protein
MSTLYDLHKLIADDIKVLHKNMKEKFNKFQQHHKNKNHTIQSVSVVDFKVPENSTQQKSLYKGIQKQTEKLKGLCTELQEAQNAEIKLDLEPDEYGEHVLESIDMFIQKTQKYTELLAEIKAMIEHKTKGMHEKVDYILSKSRVFGGSPKTEQYLDTISSTYRTYEEHMHEYKKFLMNTDKSILKATQNKPENIVVTYLYIADLHNIIITFQNILMRLKETLHTMAPYFMFRKQKQNVIKCLSYAKEDRQKILIKASKILEAVNEPYNDIEDFKSFIHSEIEKSDLTLAERILRDILRILKPKYVPSPDTYQELLETIKIQLQYKNILHADDVKARNVKELINSIYIRMYDIIHSDNKIMGFLYYKEKEETIKSTIDRIIRPEKQSRKVIAHNKSLLKDKLYDLVIEFLETNKFYVSYHNKKQISKIIIDELGKKANDTETKNMRNKSNKAFHIALNVQTLIEDDEQEFGDNTYKQLFDKIHDANIASSIDVHKSPSSPLSNKTPG